MPKLIVPGAVLKTAAAGLGSVQGLLGEGFHPDRVKKLMISNNISGKKLLEDGYALNYSLEEAVRDWWKDCGEDELV